MTRTGAAVPTIAQLLEQFLHAQRGRLKPRTLKRYEEVLALFTSYLDGYAYQGLSETDAALLERSSNSKAEGSRTFCELFGADHLLENLDGFLGYFLVRKVIAGEELLRASGTVTKRLSKWLAANGHISAVDAEYAAESSGTAFRDLPRAERAAQILREYAEQLVVDVAALPESDYFEFDHFPISRVEPQQIWFEIFHDGALRELGPIPAPESATRLLRPGWSVSCSLGRVGKSWRLLEVASIYSI